MIHIPIPDTPTYLAAENNGHTLAQLFYRIMAPFGLEAVALVQIGLIWWGAWQLATKMGFKDWRLKYVAFVVLLSPSFYWGRQIGSDALGYAFFLLALSMLGSHWKYGLLASLATLTRFQYVALFAGFLTFKRTAWLPVVMGAGLFWVAWTGWMGMMGLYSKVYKTIEYTNCAVPIKPSDMSHAEFFNLVWGGHYIVPAANPTEVCVRSAVQIHKPLGAIWAYRDVYWKLLVSKVRSSFMPHQVVLLGLLLLLSSSWRLVFVCVGMYAFVLLTSTAMYFQYTLMVECVLIALGAKMYDEKY